jgi:hypothetical protein
LHFWGAGVVLTARIISDNSGLGCFFDSHALPFTSGVQSTQPYAP